jgi:putative integral membrane protein (TIGR02587 family)
MLPHVNACKLRAFILSAPVNVTMSDGEAVQRVGTWRREFDDLVRGLSGGFLFGIPLLYTMEVWWLGAHSEPWRLLLLLCMSFGINWLLGHFAGFRQASVPVGTVTDALEAMALGAVACVITLVVLGELQLTMPLESMIGVVVLESVPFSLGVSIANGFLSGSKDDPRGEARNQYSPVPDGQGPVKQHPRISGTLRDAGATVAGALFIAFSIAPTEEVPMLASNLTSLGMIGLMCFSVLVSYAITFEAGFADQQARLRQQGLFQRPLSETLFSYLVSLVVAAVLLWIFKQLSWNDPWQVWLDRTIVLGLPAAIGGSAGRLAVGG